MTDEKTQKQAHPSAGMRLGAAFCYVLKILHVAWVTILSFIAAILGYAICILGLLAGQPETSRDIARAMGIWWRD